MKGPPMRSVLKAIRRKLATFRAVWRLDGPAVAFRVARLSARNSIVYRAGRLLEWLHLRSPAPTVAWRHIDLSALRISVVDSGPRHPA